jgi:hypothetical protein
MFLKALLPDVFTGHPSCNPARSAFAAPSSSPRLNARVIDVQRGMNKPHT